MPGKIIVKMGLFDEIPKAQLEIYTKNKQAWEPDYGIPTFAGAPAGQRYQISFEVDFRYLLLEMRIPTEANAPPEPDIESLICE